MKRRSIAGFVMGLISGIGMGIMSYYLIVVFAIADSFAAAADQATYYSLLPYANMVGAILAIVGACLCFKRARAGGIIMLIGALFMLTTPVYSIITSNEFVPLLGLIILPIVLLVIGAICAMTAKVREPKLSYDAPSYMQQPQARFCEHCGSPLTNGQCHNCGARQQ